MSGQILPVLPKIKKSLVSIFFSVLSLKTFLDVALLSNFVAVVSICFKLFQLNSSGNGDQNQELEPKMFSSLHG